MKLVRSAPLLLACLVIEILNPALAMGRTLYDSDKNPLSESSESNHRLDSSRTMGTQTVGIINVNMRARGRLPYTDTEILDAYFGLDRFSLQTITDCTYGELKFVPCEALAPDGLLDFDYDDSANFYLGWDGAKRWKEDIEGALLNESMDIRGLCDKSIIIGPDIDSFFYAQGEIGGQVITLQDINAISGPVICHEMGRTLGFMNSGVQLPGQSYETDGDQSGLMGRILDPSDINPPRYCFDSVKNYQAGWFADTSISLDWRGEDLCFTTIGESQVDLGGPDDYTVVRVTGIENPASIFFHCNTATGINAGSREFKNKTMVTFGSSTISETITIFVADEDGDTFTSPALEGNSVATTITATITNDGDLQRCNFCISLESEEPSPGPSPGPTPGPSPGPSFAACAGQPSNACGFVDIDVDGEGIPGYFSVCLFNYDKETYESECLHISELGDLEEGDDLDNGKYKIYNCGCCEEGDDPIPDYCVDSEPLQCNLGRYECGTKKAKKAKKHKGEPIYEVEYCYYDTSKGKYKTKCEDPYNPKIKEEDVFESCGECTL